MPNITIREYHPESGALLGNISILKFGRVSSGTHTRVKVIDVAFDEVSSVGNIKIGLVSSGGITVNGDPQGISADGSASNGNFGIEDTLIFDAVKSSTPLSRHFAGLNSTASASNANNVSIGSRSSNVSNYIYLDIQVGATLSGAANGSYKVFFDYS